MGTKRVQKGTQRAPTSGIMSQGLSKQKKNVEKFGQCCEKSSWGSKVAARRVDFWNRFGLTNGSNSVQQIDANKVEKMTSDPK